MLLQTQTPQKEFRITPTYISWTKDAWKESKRSFGLHQTIPCEARTLERANKSSRLCQSVTWSNAGKSLKELLGYAKLIMWRTPKKRVGTEFLITPSRAEQSNTPKGSSGFHQEKWQNKPLQSENNTHNHDFLWQKLRHLHISKKKKNKASSPHNIEKIRNTCSKAAHTVSFST